MNMKLIMNDLEKEFAPGEIESALLNVMTDSSGLNNPESYKLILSSLDYTSLNITDTVELAVKIVSKVNSFQKVFPGLPNVAAICVYPNLIEVIRKNLLPHFNDFH
jgi:deoxyribose-phosphate aldolase